MKLKNISILDLKPTQFVLGMKEIESKVKLISQFNKEELKEYCLNHQIPVVLGPKKTLYMIDHHHFSRACWETKTTGFIIKVVHDLHTMNEQAFWNYMVKMDWTYLHDQFGLGPHTPQSLPMDIRCMADDPYRSLAWAVRDKGGIKKVNTPFFEFKWAAFFRMNLPINLHSKSDFKAAIKAGIKLAKSKEAKHLPGYAFR